MSRLNYQENGRNLTKLVGSQKGRGRFSADDILSRYEIRYGTQNRSILPLKPIKHFLEEMVDAGVLRIERDKYIFD